MNNFIDNFYGTLFTPSKTFGVLAEKPVFGQSILVVVLTSMLRPLLEFGIQTTQTGMDLLMLKLSYAILGGLTVWALMAFLIGIIAYFFNNEGKTTTFLTLSAFALLPQIFVAPVELLKAGGAFSYFLGILIGLAIGIWTICLLFLAVIKTYDTTVEKTLAFSTVPLLSTIVLFNWTATFFSSIYYIFKQ